MGESKLNINSLFKVTVRTANAIFRGGCVSTSRVLFIDRRLYVNSDWTAQCAMVGCSIQAKVAYCFLNPAGKKTGERTSPVFPLPHAFPSIYILTYLFLFFLPTTS